MTASPSIGVLPSPIGVMAPDGQRLAPCGSNGSLETADTAGSQRAPSLVVLHVMPDLFGLGGNPVKIAAVTRGLRDRGVRQVFHVLGDANDLVRQITASSGRVLRIKRRASFDPRLALTS